MAKYKERVVQVTTWQRVAEFRILLPLNGTPRLECIETRVVDDGNTQHLMNIGRVAKDIVNPLETFDLINPATEEPTGETASYRDLYIALLSAYREMAEARDAAAQPMS